VPRGVGERTRPPAVEGEVRGDVDVDEEAPGTVGEAWGSVNRRRGSQGSGGLRLEIAAAPARWCLINLLSRSKDGRRVSYCEEIVLGLALFIDGEVTDGCCERASMAWLLRRSKGRGEDGYG
jgi:hypothetical protein